MKLSKLVQVDEKKLFNVLDDLSKGDSLFVQVDEEGYEKLIEYIRLNKDYNLEFLNLKEEVAGLDPYSVLIHRKYFDSGETKNA